MLCGGGILLKHPRQDPDTLHFYIGVYFQAHVRVSQPISVVSFSSPPPTDGRSVLGCAVVAPFGFLVALGAFGFFVGFGAFGFLVGFGGLGFFVGFGAFCFFALASFSAAFFALASV